MRMEVLCTLGFLCGAGVAFGQGWPVTPSYPGYPQGYSPGYPTNYPGPQRGYYQGYPTNYSGYQRGYYPAYPTYYANYQRGYYPAYPAVPRASGYYGYPQNGSGPRVVSSYAYPGVAAAAPQAGVGMPVRPVLIAPPPARTAVPAVLPKPVAGTPAASQAGMVKIPPLPVAPPGAPDSDARQASPKPVALEPLPGPAEPPDKPFFDQLADLWDCPFHRTCKESVWVDASYLLAWIRPGPLNAPLVTTGSANDLVPGAIGQPNTAVLFGDALNFKTASGVRMVVGGFLDDQDRLSLEAVGLWLAPQYVRFQDGSDSNGNPLIARSFFNVLTGARRPPRFVSWRALGEHDGHCPIPAVRL